MKKTIFLFFGIVLLQACQDSQDAAFEIFQKDFQEKTGVVFIQKEEGQSGEYFPPFYLMGKDSLKNSLAFYEEQKAAAGIFEDEKLSSTNQKLHTVVFNWMAQKIEYLEEGKEVDARWPIFISLKQEVKDDSQTNEEQFLKINQRLEDMPAYFEKVKTLLQSPDEERMNNAINESVKGYFYLKNELPLLIRKPDILKKDQIAFSEKNRKAQLTLKDFIAFLNSQIFELNDRK